jgi:tetratricopeptide (TPR) repeat protein
MTTNIARFPSASDGGREDLIASLQKVLELYPDHAQAHHDLGGAYYQSEDNDKALEHYQKAVDLDPENGIYQRSLADYFYTVAGRVEDALGLYKKILGKQPGNLEAALMAGHISVALKNFDDAEQFYKQALEIEPWNQDAGQLLEKLQNRQKEIDRPLSVEEQYADIMSMINDGRTEDAVGEIEILLESNPDFALAHNDLGVLYYQQGASEKALTCYEAAARLEPANLTYQKNLADYYYAEQGRVEEAMQIYVKILETEPEDAETIMILGHICVALHRFDDAEAFYNRLLAIEPWNAEARENLQKLSRRPEPPLSNASPEEQYAEIQKQIENGGSDAINLLENFLVSQPQFALAHNDLGVFYYNQGNKEKALSHYEKAVQFDPQNLNFKKNLADYYFVVSGRIEDALAIYQKVLEVEPCDVEALMSLGVVCQALERPEDASHFYNRVLENEPWNVDAREQLEKLRS